MSLSLPSRSMLKILYKQRQPPFRMKKLNTVMYRLINPTLD
jgi:hypothetical protein